MDYRIIFFSLFVVTIITCGNSLLLTTQKESGMFSTNIHFKGQTSDSNLGNINGKNSRKHKKALAPKFSRTWVGRETYSPVRKFGARALGGNKTSYNEALLIKGKIHEC